MPRTGKKCAPRIGSTRTRTASESRQFPHLGRHVQEIADGEDSATLPHRTGVADALKSVQEIVHFLTRENIFDDCKPVGLHSVLGAGLSDHQLPILGEPAQTNCVVWMMSETMTVMPEVTNLQQPAAPKTLPLMMLAVGFVLMLGSVILAGRLIWEMTSLTWQYGPQMIGFSLAHGPGALLFLFPLALFVWLLASACTVIVWKAKRKVVRNRSWIALGSAVLALGLLSLPQGFWNVIFVGKMAASPRVYVPRNSSSTRRGEGEDRVVEDADSYSEEFRLTQGIGKETPHFTLLLELGGRSWWVT